MALQSVDCTPFHAQASALAYNYTLQCFVHFTQKMARCNSIFLERAERTPVLATPHGLY